MNWRKDIPFMRIRPYIPSKDYEYVSIWIDDERTHAFWCANLLPYPMTQKSFHDLLEKNAMDWTDSAYVATENSGQAVGFFCYSVNTTDNIGFLKFVIVDKTSKQWEKLRRSLRQSEEEPRKKRGLRI